MMRYTARYHYGFDRHWIVYDGDCLIAGVESYKDADRIVKMLNAYEALVEVAEAVDVGVSTKYEHIRQLAEAALKLAKGE